MPPEYITLEDGFVIDTRDAAKPLTVWQVRWSTGDNIPCPTKPGTHLKEGLWLITKSDTKVAGVEVELNHYSQLLYAWGESMHTRQAFTSATDQVSAYTRYHAEYRLMLTIREQEEARQRKKLGH